MGICAFAVTQGCTPCPVSSRAQGTEGSGAIRRSRASESNRRPPDYKPASTVNMQQVKLAISEPWCAVGARRERRAV